VKLMNAFPAGDYEHVFMSSEDELEYAPPAKSATITAVLEQEVRGGITHRMTLFENGYLDIKTVSRQKQGSGHELKLVFLDPNPARRSALLPWATVCAAAMTAVVASVVAWHQGPAWAPVTLLTLAASVAAMSGGALAWQRNFNTLVFYTRHGRAPVLELARHRPEHRRARQFIAALESAIRRAIAEHPAPRSHLLRDEMLEHRRLLEVGGLQPQDFEKAKARILRAHG
jgi:hypothetical protein